MSDHKTVIASSHIGPINVGGIEVPIGFLASHRKKLHAPCKKGNGFVVMRTKAGLVNHLCPCAVAKGIKKLKQIGGVAWAQLGKEWLDAEMARLALDEARCQQEGYDAAVDATNPYPEKTDQELWWRDGHARAAHDREALLEIEHGEEIREAAEVDPYAEGADAALAGQSETTNPYDPVSDEHLSWNDGHASVSEPT